MSKIKVIKTLRHLNELFLDSSKTVYSTSFSLDIFETIQSAEEIDLKALAYSDLIKKLTSTISKTNTKDVIDDFKVGKNLEYKKVEKVESVLEYSVRGDIIDLWLPGYDYPVRLEFFGEDLEECNFYDNYTNRKIEKCESLIFFPYLPRDLGELESIRFKDGKGELEKIIFTDKSLGREGERFLNGLGRSYTYSSYEAGSRPPLNPLLRGGETKQIEIMNTDFAFPPLFFSNKTAIVSEIESFKSRGFKVLVKSRDKDVLALGDKLNDGVGPHPNLPLQGEGTNPRLDFQRLETLPAGFVSEEMKLVYLTDRELFGVIDLKKSKSDISSKTLQKILRQFEGEISVGDYVVHEDYGIAIYSGFEQEEVDGRQSDFLLLKFEGDDELFVPIDQINKITKYLANEGGTPKLTMLGTKSWKTTKKKVRQTAIITAEKLIKHYAKREIAKAHKVDSNDSNDFKKFVENFSYKETPDQLRSINEVINDLEKETPMNRLLVGDVGFGKTEVIMRAAFKMAEEKKQVAILAPTTILASQHFDVFNERFGLSKFNIKLLSRFNTPKENRKVVDDLNNGSIDIVIGTHRLLSTDIKFKKLGLLVVDEEQKFGVKQKEKIKQLNYGVHLLSVSATPIPRSLSLALSGVQDISIISTPPEGRQGVDTEIIFEDWKESVEMIQKEISRGGQVYFIHNRVESIQGITKKLKNLIPGIKIEFAHGQMRGEDLDKLITDFYKKRFDVLVATSIIENGLDIPNVNTIIIHDAHKFGLSQLYQMRGRVGRSEIKAYCYLMCPRPSKLVMDSIDADDQHALKIMLKANSKKAAASKLYMQRLQSLVDNTDLGAGFRVASKDLEIRGAGNILGEKQSGHINGVGYALYIEMLADAIEKIKVEVDVHIEL